MCNFPWKQLVVLVMLCLSVPLRAGAADGEASPFEPGSWLMVVIPDTQSYVDHREQLPILNGVMDWIAENAGTLNIGLVLQEGDIVFQNGARFAFQSTGNQNSTRQWSNARLAFARIRDHVPCILATGNHDYGRGNAENRSSRFADYFRPQDFPLLDPDRGGILYEMFPNAAGQLTMENAAYDFTAPDGRQLLVLSLEWGPRRGVLAWADELCGRPEFSSHTKVLLTHAYTYHDDTRYDWEEKGRTQSHNPHVYAGTAADTNDGEELWDALVRRHGLMQLVFSGHVGGDQVGRLSTVNDAGLSCHQMLFNAQFLPNGGDGWIRLLEFLPDGHGIHVRTYSPWFDNDGNEDTAAWRSGPDDDFMLEIEPAA